MTSFPRSVPALLLMAAGIGLAGQVHASGAGEIPSSPQEIRPLLIGTKIPAVTVQNAEGSGVDLAELFAKDPTVLIVYRGGW